MSALEKTEIEKEASELSCRKENSIFLTVDLLIRSREQRGHTAKK